jgi:hypothetical protein
MTSSDRLTIILTAIGMLGIPTLAFVIRATVKWTRVEERLGRIVDDVSSLVKDSDNVHRELSNQMREDRKVTNERLTWLERHLWDRAPSAAKRNE